jgi:hypothetical protein
LRSAVLDLAWYQYFLLDVIAVLALVIVCGLVAVYCFFRDAIRKLFDTKHRVTKSVVKKKTKKP